MNKLQKRDYFIKKLFDEISIRTLGSEIKIKLNLLIIDNENEASSCRLALNDYGKLKSITIILNLDRVKKVTTKGYLNDYYIDRAEKINKYVLHNRHNEIRFALYHALKHAYLAITDLNKFMYGSEVIAEKDADNWALAHIQNKNKISEYKEKI